MKFILLLVTLPVFYAGYLYVMYGWNPRALARWFGKRLASPKNEKTPDDKKDKTEHRATLITTKNIFDEESLSGNQKVDLTSKHDTNPPETEKTLAANENKDRFATDLAVEHPRVIPPAKVEVMFSQDDTPAHWTVSPEAAEAEELEEQAKDINWEEENAIAGRYALELDREGEPMYATGLPIEEIVKLAKNLHTDSKELTRDQKTETCKIIRKLEDTNVLKTMMDKIPLATEKILELMDELDIESLKPEPDGKKKRKTIPPAWSDFDINQFS